MLIAGRSMTLVVKELEPYVIKTYKEILEECNGSESPDWLNDRYLSIVRLGDIDIPLNKGGSTLEEAKQLCTDFAVSLCKQMLYELGEDIELTHVIAEV